jgi:hypothetical protein
VRTVEELDQNTLWLPQEAVYFMIKSTNQYCIKGSLSPLQTSIPSKGKKPGMGSFDSKTDVKKRGLASADRNNKATLLLTAPYSMTKSYAKGLSPRMVKLQDVS